MVIVVPYTFDDILSNRYEQIWKVVCRQKVKRADEQHHGDEAKKLLRYH